MSPVPHSDQVKATRKHARFEESKEESGNQQRFIVLHETLHDGDEAEEEHVQAQPDIWSELLEENVAWDFEAKRTYVSSASFDREWSRSTYST